MAPRPTPIRHPSPVSWRGLLLATVAVTALGLPSAFAQDAATGTTPSGTPGTAGVNTAAQSQAADQAAAGTLTLPTVDVQGTAWRSWQPVDGYVAPVATTGTKTDTPLIESPQSTSVVTRQQMDDQASQTVSQALRYTPGVLSEIRPASRYDSNFIRGFGGQGVGAAYVNFLDGLRQQRGVSYAIPSVDPWLLERIEVLRGPASVLYGQTGSGGIVNLVSKRPTETPIHEVRLEAGSHARLQTAFDFGGKLTEDGQFLYRLTGIGRTGNTQYDGIKDQRIAIAPALTWRPDADTTLTFLSSYQHDPNGGFYNFVPAAGTVLPNRNGKLKPSLNPGEPDFDKYDRTVASVGYQLEHRLDSIWTVRQNFRYSHIDSEFSAVSFRSLAANQRTASRASTLSIEHADTLALDNQAQADFNTGPVRHTVLTGLDWSRSSAKRRLGQGTATTLDLFAPVYGSYIARPQIGASGTTYQNTDQLGLYGQDQMVWDRWHLTVGVRNDWATSETYTRTYSTRSSQDDSKFTWRAGLLYLFDSGIAPYVNYSTSFLPNSGTYSPSRGGGAFSPTTGEQYEAGVKYQPPGMNSFIQVAAYHIKQKDVLTPDPVNTNYSIQTGEIRSQGVEVEGRASLTSNIDLIGTYSYIDAEVTRSTTANVQGKRPQQVPEHIASAWANYRFTDNILRGLSLGAGVRYVGSTYGDETNSFKVPDFALFDAAVRYDVGERFPQAKGLELTLNANNIADKAYVSSCSSATACYFGDRLLVIGGIRVRW